MNYLEEPQKNQDNQLQEIDFSEYFRIIKKQKKIIISLFFLGIMLGIIWFFVGPTKYIGSSLIRVGGIKGIFQQIELIENPENILEIIKNKSYIQEQEVKFFGNIAKKNNLIEVDNLMEIKVEGNNYQEVESVLNQANEDILKSHLEFFEQEKSSLIEKREFFEDKIKQIEEEVSFLMVRGFDTSSLRAQIHDIEIEIENIKAETDKIFMTEIVEGPDIIEKRQSYLVIIFLALLGLFLGFVLAFLRNSWQKGKGVL